MIPPNRTSGIIDKFSSLGLKVQITEFDVTIYTSKTDTLNIGFTPEREQKQIDFYKMAFKVLREKKDLITGVPSGMSPIGEAGLTDQTKKLSFIV